MHADQMHELFDRHHQVSPNLNQFLNWNTNISVKHEVIWNDKKACLTWSNQIQGEVHFWT